MSVARDRIALAALCLALLGSATAARAQAVPRVSIIRETRVTLALRFDLVEPGGATQPATMTVEGRPGQLLSVTRNLGGTADPLRVFLALTPEPDDATARCGLRVVSTVVRGRDRAVVKRNLSLHPDQLAIVDLWSATGSRARLVLGVTATWRERPVVIPIKNGMEPVDFVVETLVRTAEGERVIQERRLTGLVGSPLRYSFRHVARGAAPAGSPVATDELPDVGGGLVLEITPEAIGAGEIDLSARLSIENEHAPAPDDIVSSAGVREAPAATTPPKPEPAPAAPATPAATTAAPAPPEPQRRTSAGGPVITPLFTVPRPDVKAATGTAAKGTAAVPPASPAPPPAAPARTAAEVLGSRLGDAPATGMRRDAMTREHVAMGMPVELWLPLDGKSATLVFRITPFF